jgi:hypothetical protein
LVDDDVYVVEARAQYRDADGDRDQEHETVDQDARDDVGEHLVVPGRGEEILEHHRSDEAQDRRRETEDHPLGLLALCGVRHARVPVDLGEHQRAYVPDEQGTAQDIQGGTAGEHVGHEQHRPQNGEPARPAGHEAAVRDGEEENAEGNLARVLQELYGPPERRKIAHEVLHRSRERRPAEDEQGKRSEKRHPVVRAAEEDHGRRRGEDRRAQGREPDRQTGVKIEGEPERPQVAHVARGEHFVGPRTRAAVTHRVELGVRVRQARGVEPEDGEGHQDPGHPRDQEPTPLQPDGRDLGTLALRQRRSVPASGALAGESHSETWAGRIVSSTTPTNRPTSASSSTSSRRAPENSWSVLAASYLLR